MLEAYKAVYRDDFLRSKNNRNSNKVVMILMNTSIHPSCCFSHQEIDRSREYESTFHVSSLIPLFADIRFVFSPITDVTGDDHVWKIICDYALWSTSVLQ